MLLLIEPVMYLLIAIAEQANKIEPVIYDEENVDEPSQETALIYILNSLKK